MGLSFRVWDTYNKIMSEVLLIDFLNGVVDLSYGNIEIPLEQVKVLQYVELRDKNGKRYCQDDLVLYKGVTYRLIKGAYAFELLGFFETNQDSQGDFFSEGAYLDGEIVGNIYESKKEQLND